jgi:hypothetical protein
MEFDGELNAVFSHRTEFDTTVGTVWRFIMDYNRTLVIIPCQTEDSPAKKVHCVPDRVGSVLAGPQGLGELANLTNRIAQANVEMEEAWEFKVHEKVKADLTKWRKQRKLPWLDEWERDRKKADKKIEERCKELETYPEGKERERIVNEAYAKLNDTARMEKVESDRSKLKKQQIELKKKHRTAINKKKADRAKKVEGELLEDIRKFLKKHGIKRHSIKDVLKPFYQFIKNEIYPPTNDIRNSSNKDYDLKLIVKKIKILTKVELREKIVRSDWTAIGHPIKVDDFDQICFVAEFGVGSHFIRSMKMCVHDDKDAETFYRVAPSEAERERIESELELEREKTRIYREVSTNSLQPTFNLGKEAGQGGPLYMRPNEVRILTGWSQETIDTYVEQGKLKPIRSGNAKVKGGKRRRMRWFLRQDVLKIYSEDKQKR